MPRNPNNKRIEILVSPEQYEALLRQAEIEGYIVLDSNLEPGAGLETKGSVAEYIRDHLVMTVPGFAAAKPLTARGKYKRNTD